MITKSTTDGTRINNITTSVIAERRRITLPIVGLAASAVPAGDVPVAIGNFLLRSDPDGDDSADTFFRFATELPAALGSGMGLRRSGVVEAMRRCQARSGLPDPHRRWLY
ncbi:MAG: hypothetical protein FGM58_05950 [Acidimicrobiia bacterium]|nr:hypothetical protein [Acidimicrobiia bacterium]